MRAVGSQGCGAASSAVAPSQKHSAASPVAIPTGPKPAQGWRCLLRGGHARTRCVPSHAASPRGPSFRALALTPLPSFSQPDPRSSHPTTPTPAQLAPRIFGRPSGGRSNLWRCCGKSCSFHLGEIQPPGAALPPLHTPQPAPRCHSVRAGAVAPLGSGVPFPGERGWPSRCVPEPSRNRSRRERLECGNGAGFLPSSI